MEIIGGAVSESPNLFLRQIFVPPNCPKNATAMQKVQWVKDRNFYACKGVMNIIDYSNRKEAIDCSDSNISDLADIAERMGKTSDIIGYSHARPGSTGLFLKDGFCSEEKVQEIKSVLSNTKSNIWNGVISCKNKGGSVDIQSAEEAKEFFEKNIKKLFDKSGLDFDNIEYAVAFHNNTQHSHLHYTFWEKEPKYIDKYGKLKHTYKGVLPYKNICALRAGFERSVIDSNLSQIRTDRKAVTDSVKSMLSHAKEDCDPVQLKIFALARTLPKSGRLSYDSENMNMHKKSVDGIVSHILEKTSVKDKWSVLEDNLSKYQKGLDDIRSYSPKKGGQEKAEFERNYMTYSQKVIDDIYRRIGSIVIREAVEYNKLVTKKDRLAYNTAKSSGYNKRLKTAHRKIGRRIKARFGGKAYKTESEQLLEQMIHRLAEEKRKLSKGEENAHE